LDLDLGDTDFSLLVGMFVVLSWLSLVMWVWAMALMTVRLAIITDFQSEGLALFVDSNDFDFV